MRWALAILSVGALWAGADEPAFAQQPQACRRDEPACLQNLYASECSRPASTLTTCLVVLQRLETVRRRSRSPDVALLLAQTLRTVALKDPSPRAKERYLERARATYRDVVKSEPFNASGYLGLAELAETGEQRVEWLRGAVRAEYRPADMERLADSLAKDIGGHTGDLESALVLEDAYTLEATAAEKWRYAALAWQRYGDAADRYPLAASERTLQNVVTRLEADIDYPVLQRILLEPASHLPYLADAFATLCEKSIAAIVTLDECMAGLELAVATAEGSSEPGTRRWLAEAVLRGMRTIAGEVPPRSAAHQLKFLRWIDRLVATRLSPVDVEADLLEARADFTEDLFERAQALLSAIELCPNRSDLRLKLGATYVNLQLWFEALEQLRVADYLVLPEEHEERARVAKLLETANKAYDARFLPPDVPASAATGR